MTKRILIVLGVVAATIGLLHVDQAVAKDETYVMRLGYATKFDPQDFANNHFAERLKKLVGDRIQVQLYPAGQLGSGEIMLQQIEQGNLHGTTCPTAFLGGRYDLITMLDLPYLIERDLEPAIDYLNGPIGQKLTAGLAKHNMINVLFYPQGERLLLTTFKVDSIDKFKGKKIRVMPAKVQIDTYNAWGASGIPMNVPELYTALQQGTVDGLDSPPQFLFAMKYYEVAKFLLMGPRIPLPIMFIVNKKWFDSLPSDLQKAIFEAASDRNTLVQQTLKVNNEALEKMEKAGVTIVKPSEGFQQEMRARSGEVHKKFLSAHPDARPLYDEIVQALAPKK